MSTSLNFCFGWYPDLPDHRDFSPADDEARRLLKRLGPRGSKNRRAPTCVDLREYCPVVADQASLDAAPAHAVVALLQYFQRRASGRVIQPSRLFAHYVAQRLANGQAPGAGLRATLKGVARFGFPPETYWPYDVEKAADEPDPFVYGFSEESRGLTYVRLDDSSLAGERVLKNVKSFLAAGFPSVCGFVVASSASHDPCIPFPTVFDAPLGGQAVMVVGYDDKMRIRSEKGALLIQNSWGVDWGDGGFGWLPYRYVADKIAVDFWTLLKPDWLASGEFSRP